MRVYIAEDYRVCAYCGRRFNKADYIRIGHEQGINMWRPVWGPLHPKYCGPYCTRLKSLQPITTLYGKSMRQVMYKAHMLRYVLKYANTDVMLKDITYL